MLNPVVVNIVTFFYPVGNTPAVCLTQDLPPGQDANVLLLGCGDARNILFSTYSEAAFKSRRLDFTCCDFERAILARNILLFTLLIDDTEGSNITSIWNIYYHLFLDEQSLAILQVQSKKLYLIANSMKNWQHSKYGNLLKFCDQGTLSSVREVWSSYSTSYPKGDDRVVYDRRFKACIQKAIDKKSRILGKGLVLTGFRSAAPISLPSLADLPNLHQHYWDHGITDRDPSNLSKSKHSNPMFASLTTDTFTLHYGTDPLLGFHLATAYASLTIESPLRLKAVTDNLHKVVVAARTQFEAWAASFRRYASHNLTIRFFVGDAIAFCHTLQHMRITGGDVSANWYRTPYHLEALLLDGTDYGTAGEAPLSFNVIDTSNLADHVGPVNLLVATSPLLENSISASLYTESLVKRAENHKEWMDAFLCGHFPTISILLGLFPSEYWTNATAISTVDEGLLSKTRSIMGSQEDENRQMRTRVVWKRPISASHGMPQMVVNLHSDEGNLAHVLHNLYQGMFQNEDMGKLFSNMNLLTIQNNSTLHYHRGSFAAFLHLVKSRMKVDWKQVMDALLHLIETDSTILMGMNYIQELYLQLHLLDTYSKPEFQPSFYQNISNHKPIGICVWNDIPAVVCITLKVPRNKLGVFTDISPHELGTPPVHCILQSCANSTSRPWQNIFAAVQLSFGTVTTSGSRNDDDFRIYITEDKDGWSGHSPLIVSFYSPTCVALLEPQMTTVAFGVQSTPNSSTTFMKTLGLEMNVYDTILTDEENVFVTRYRPNQSGYTSVGGFKDSDMAADEPPNKAIRTTMSANIDPRTAKIVGFTGRVDVLSEKVKSILRDQSPVETVQTSPCIIAILIGKSKTQYLLYFPAPVLNSQSKTRIARKSSYVEVEAPIMDPIKDNRFPRFMYPLFSVGRSPVIWNMPHLDPQCLPILDRANTDNLQWLVTHTSLQFSTRERNLREASIASTTGIQKDIRVNFKDSLFSMFMQFTGLQRQRAHVFGINNPTGGGIHVIIFVSCLRLDLANHTVILDSAVLPLTDHLMPHLNRFLAALSSMGICSIKVDNDELTLWKELLPAFVERCRTWEHLPSCEYTRKSQIPLSVQNGQPCLCSCGKGILPSKFISGVPGWDSISKHCVRAVISPSFAVPFVEPIFDISNLRGRAELNGDRCQTCQREKSDNGAGLLRCSKCHAVKYCSTQCQRADWKAHKKVCAKG